MYYQNNRFEFWYKFLLWESIIVWLLVRYFFSFGNSRSASFFISSSFIFEKNLIHRLRLDDHLKKKNYKILWKKCYQIYDLILSWMFFLPFSKIYLYNRRLNDLPWDKNSTLFFNHHHIPSSANLSFLGLGGQTFGMNIIIMVSIVLAT